MLTLLHVSLTSNRCLSMYNFVFFDEIIHPFAEQNSGILEEIKTEAISKIGGKQQRVRSFVHEL